MGQQKGANQQENLGNITKANNGPTHDHSSSNMCAKNKHVQDYIHYSNFQTIENNKLWRLI